MIKLTITKILADVGIFITFPPMLLNAKIFNTIIIGVAAKRMDFDKKQWLEVIESTVPPKTIELNKAAFEAGYALV
jgi:Pyruvate/2-oxoacid:ferredoxin oxidoreductase gamma subunit